ncbi:hypothetical protein A2U01_0068650, partial [Trifolium medium]|nr:hypothetical protein [Trifolium medium]
YNPPSVGVIVAQRWFAGHTPLLITRYDHILCSLRSIHY